MSALLALILLVTPPASAIWLHAPAGLRPWLAAWFAFASLVSFALYASDKHRAGAAESRVPEKLLHLSAMFGGWPGAFLAQRLLRHKTAKPRFQITFWCVIATHQLAALDLLFSNFISRALLP